MVKKDITHCGRNSTTLGIRISLSDYGLIKERADRENITPTEWAKQQVLSNIQYASTTEETEITLNDRANVSLDTKSQRASTTDKMPVIPGLVMQGNRIVGTVKPTSNLPLYDARKHKAGARVMIQSPYSKRLIEMVIPELDADGAPILGE